MFLQARPVEVYTKNIEMSDTFIPKKNVRRLPRAEIEQKFSRILCGLRGMKVSRMSYPQIHLYKRGWFAMLAL
ncbi:MAG: hypothetical protein A2649_03550 [Candidatus Yanofskybacteria bacterium RIFCSPHIGHO2_01_FULL_41_26]|uniref:Uncharacterized protein n=1 Tax=Candidatus Yanofskybacteria bacterium RIFCSPHIGHO2_01_FULL_41_26 TaxID=1802661 RepID=A0A1F8EDZ4_9BACT|nr:MAG: hypothetical protein A2649_03550 [Candidatus Yanofskybacteria bacterium RIFCSPHIGHO2_01_FULL_41_26]